MFFILSSVELGTKWKTFLKSLQIILQTGRNNKRYFIITPQNNFNISVIYKSYAYYFYNLEESLERILQMGRYKIIL
ncbi:MAG: hypothetical protein JJV93_02115 [Alphaproteobacteria bacterium]|nr:hypothetical protein [Alphaproteobacteria bacterium]